MVRAARADKDTARRGYTLKRSTTNIGSVSTLLDCSAFEQSRESPKLFGIRLEQPLLILHAQLDDCK